MLTRLTACLLVGLVIGEAGGQTVTLHFDLDGDPLTASDTAYTGNTITWTVHASFTGYDDPSSYFGGIVGRFDPSEAGIGTVSNLTNLMANAGVDPIADGAAVTEINIFHSVLLGSDDPTNPLPIFSFQIDIDQDAIASGGPFALTYAASGIVSQFANSLTLSLPDIFESFSVVSDRVVIPGQAAIAVMLCGIMIPARRRAR